MNFFRSLRHNINKTSYIINRIIPVNNCKNGTNVINDCDTLPISHLWPDWLKWNSPTEGGPALINSQPVFKINKYQFYQVNEKLILDKKFLEKEKFKFHKTPGEEENTEGAVNPKLNSIHLLIKLDFVTTTTLPKTIYYLHLDKYMKILAKKDKNYLICKCEDDASFINLFSDISKLTDFLVSYETFISNIITFELLDSEDETTCTQPTYNQLNTNNKIINTNNDITVVNLHKPFIISNKLKSVPLRSENQIEVSKFKMKPLSNFTDKPPNILIYTGSNEDTTKSYMNTYSILSQCLSRHRYVVYHLKRNQINTTPWMENTLVLILAVNKITKNDVDNVFLKYFLSGGCVISLACNFDEFFVRRVKSLSEMSGTNYIVRLNYEKWNDVSVVSGCNVGYDDVAPSILDEVSYTPLARDSLSNNQLIVLAKHHLSSGIALLSQVNFEKDASDLTTSSEEFIQLKQSNLERIEIFKNILSNDLGLNCEQAESPALSPILLFALDEVKQMDFCTAMKPVMKGGNVYAANKIFSYHFTTSQDYSGTVTTSTTITNNDSNNNNNSSNNNITTATNNSNNTNDISFITDSLNVQSKFNMDVYKKHLRSEILGNVVLYADVVSSTMDTLDHYLIHMPSHLGLVAIASMQTFGQGRGGNVWLSPEGCALCSLHIRLPLNSPLGQHVSCLQHLVALAIVLSVREKKGYEDIDLRIKWPNDIYFAEKLKLGGILIRSTIMQDLIHINLGCGINICNKYPTTCINDLIEQHNKLRPDQSEPLSTFTVEEFLGRLISQIDRLIRSYQLDEGQEFFESYYNYWLHNDQEVILNSIDGPCGLINGITKYGYLSVRLEDGTIVEVHPDGNSFDMMKNLIAPKIKR